MMHKILALLTDLEKSDAVLAKAATFATTQECALEILYVHEKPLFDLPDYFHSKEQQDETALDKTEIKQTLKEKLQAIHFEKDAALFVSINDTEDRVWAHTKSSPDILVITAYHKELTKKVVKKVQSPMMILKNETSDYHHIVMPVDLDKKSKICINLTKDLFLDVPIHLVYDFRYLLDISSMNVDILGIPSASPTVDIEVNELLRTQQSEIFESLKKETGLPGAFIEQNFTLEDDLLDYIHKGAFDLSILCPSHQTSFFTESIVFSLLETLQTDILIYNKGAHDE